MKWKVNNIPLPEAYLAALFAGALLHRLRPQPITPAAGLRRTSASANLLLGTLLAAWSVASAGESRLDQPQALVTTGAYRFSRNPMYLAWTFLSSGMALLVNSLWMLAALPFAFLHTHFIEIPREELLLSEVFGEQYEQYRRRVGRYL
jgi:protein-S-isoprenylcysteine O-methyltransferase Ste14